MRSILFHYIILPISLAGGSDGIIGVEFHFCRKGLARSCGQATVSEHTLELVRLLSFDMKLASQSRQSS